MKITGLVLGSFAVLAAAQVNTTPPAGEPGGPPVVAVSPAGPGPNPNKPAPPNPYPAPVKGQGVPVVGEAPVKCSVSCKIAGLNTARCSPKGVSAVAPPPKGMAPPVGAVDRAVYESVTSLLGAQLPPAPPGSSLVAFSPETRQCLCTGRNGRDLRNSGARCTSKGGPQCSLSGSPVPPQELVSGFLNQLCGGVAGWVPVSARPKGVRQPKGTRLPPKMPKLPGTGGYKSPPKQVAPPAPNGQTSSAAAPGTPGGPGLAAGAVNAAPAAPGSVVSAAAPSTPGVAGGPPVNPPAGIPAPATAPKAVSPPAVAPKAVSPPKALNPNVPVAPSSGAVVTPPTPVAVA